MNYNHEMHYCQLTSEACLRVVEDSEFTVTFYSLHTWVQLEDVVGDMRVSCDARKEWFVGRLVVGSDVLVGNAGNSYAYVWKDGTQYSNSRAEVLQIMPWCSTKWVPYIPGDPIPAGAVVGGYVGNPPVEIYAIHGIINGVDKSCGFYNPETELGYAAYNGAHVTTEMDIPVLQ